MKSNFNLNDFIQLKNQDIEYSQSQAVKMAYETIEKVLHDKIVLLKNAKTQKEKELIFAKSKVQVPKDLTDEDFEYLKNIYQSAGFNKVEYLKEKILDKKNTIPGLFIKFTDEMYIETPAKNKFYYKYFVSLS